MTTIKKINSNSNSLEFIDDYLSILFKEANKGALNNKGGPFSAIIIKNNKIISKAHNQVISNNDPTAHAEILAIRKACKKEKSIFLEDCILISSCEPCPMCLSAIMWARIPTVYYYFTRKDAAKIGFNDNEIYKYIQGKKNKLKLKVMFLPKKPIYFKNIKDPFKNWTKKEDKINY